MQPTPPPQPQEVPQPPAPACQWVAAQVVTTRATCVDCGAAKQKGHRVDRCAQCGRHKCRACPGTRRCGSRWTQLSLRAAWQAGRAGMATQPSEEGRTAQTPGPAPAPVAQPLPPPPPPDPAAPARVWRSGRAQGRGTYCDHCKRLRVRNHSVWTCEDCGTLLCPGCYAEAEDDCDGGHQAQTAAAPAAAAGAPTRCTGRSQTLPSEAEGMDAR